MHTAHLRHPVGLAILAMVCAGPASAAEPTAVDLRSWQAPDIAALPDDAYGRLVRRGEALVKETWRHLGPKAPDPAKRYAGNNLACQSCHLHGGTQAYAMPFVGVSGTFPQYRAREDAVSTIEDRVNGCMERSMNGRSLPLDGEEMKAYVAYFHFLSQGVPVAAKIEGAGTMRIKEPDRAADPGRGAAVYQETCAVCHGEDGQGIRHGEPGDAAGYQYPPLWGPDSYNDGAGMYRLLTATSFVLNNMPFGTTHEAPTLSVEDAYDVMAFVNSQPRPTKADLDQDFPNRLRKPVDMPFPPFADGFPAEQHKYGPFAPIRAELKRLQEQAAKSGATQ